MPINRIDHALVTGHRDIVRSLAYACAHHFFDMRGAGAGVGSGSCCASVKLQGVLDESQAYRYGSSQAHRLDADARVPGGMFDPIHHAERVAYNAGIAVGGAGIYPHLFVELHPCTVVNGCAAWAAANIPLINVWYLYPDTDTMVIYHGMGVDAQYGAINQLLP